jgi:hypothetical protein
MMAPTRRHDMLAADRVLLQGYHYPFRGLAYIEKSGTGYREIPVMDSSALSQRKRLFVPSPRA